MQTQIYTGSATPLCLRQVPKQPVESSTILQNPFTSFEPHKDNSSFVFIFLYNKRPSVS